MSRSPKRKQPRKADAPARTHRRERAVPEESMEAKVDVRKLQILNDRINQTIDALSQVRLSVHGLGHTGVPTSMYQPFGVPTPGIAYPTFPFTGLSPVPPIPYGAMPPIPPIPGPVGLSHTPFTTPVHPLFNLPTPFPTPFMNPMLPTIPTPGITPNWIPTTWTGGLLHSTLDPLELKLLEMRAIDPTRIRETFPYVGLF